MAAVTVTAQNVGLVSTDKSVTYGIAGETLTAGAMVYRKVSDNRWWNAVATVDMSDTATVSGTGVSLQASDSAGDGAVVAAENGSELDLGATGDKSKHYVPDGAGSGGLEEYSDLTAGEYINWWMYGTGTNFILDVQATGLTK